MTSKPEPESAPGASNLSAPEPARVRAHLEKVLASRVFAASERLSRFLRFTVEHTLDGRGSELKEYLLGVEVFDRSAAFDPRIDPIVRVEARRLRSKLRAYYETHGHDGALRIELPTGSYVPKFHLRGSAPPAATAPEGEEPAPIGNIAVLPFLNLSRDSESEYFSDGLTEELIHALTKVEGLRVVAWTSAAKWKDRQNDIAQIGRELRVATILMGSVRTSARRLRVMVRMIDVASGCFLWSETFDRELEDVFAIQEEISRATVDTLRIRLIGRKAERTMARPPSNLEAYNLYLKGRFHWNKRTREGLDRSIRYFREAVALEPRFAAGYAGLADAFTLMAEHGLVPPSGVMTEAKSAALEALKLDPDLPEAHASLALMLSLHEWRWAEAGEHYRRALELGPGYVTGHHWYGCDYLALLGRTEEALKEIRVAVELDPLSPVMTQSYAYILTLARRYEEALEQSRKVAELDPYFYKAYTGRGRVYIQIGRHDDAIRMLERGRSLAGGVPVILGALGEAYARAGDRGRALALLEDLERLRESMHVPSNTFAIVHLGLGEPERALERLEAGCDAHELSMAALKAHPVYDCLRGEPRFERLLRRIGLAG